MPVDVIHIFQRGYTCDNRRRERRSLAYESSQADLLRSIERQVVDPDVPRAGRPGLRDSDVPLEVDDLVLGKVGADRALVAETKLDQVRERHLVLGPRRACGELHAGAVEAAL